jgi:poly(A) polymerase
MSIESLATKLKSLPMKTVLEAAGSKAVYVVGGPIRDAFLERQYSDIDLAVEGEGGEVARKFASLTGGRFVPLDVEHDESRVVIGEHTYDFSGFPEGDLPSDLERRDFTINSMASDLRLVLETRGSVIDPFGGLVDLKNKLIRATTDRSFRDDPLRVLRTFRLAAQLGFEIEEGTLDAACDSRDLLGNVAAERKSYEVQLTFSQRDSFPVVSVMAETSVLCAVFPKLEETKGVAQNKLYPLDVFGHSLATYREMETLLNEITGSPFSGYAQSVSEYVDAAPRRVALLKMGALLHDIAKPDTIQPGQDDKLHFYGHDRTGAKQVEEFVLDSLRMSKKDAKMLSVLVGNHMWPHLLAGQQKITEKAMRRFWRELEENGIGVLLLAWADSLASVGPQVSSEPLQYSIKDLLSFYTARREEVSLPPLLTGNDLIEILGLEPGPVFGQILNEIEKEREEGKLSTREEALELARTMAERR